MNVVPPSNIKINQNSLNWGKKTGIKRTWCCLNAFSTADHLEVHGSRIAEAWLENFEHYFTSVWDECNCAVVWAFFGIAFLWDWNENWLFSILRYINTLKKLQVLKKTKPKTRMVTWPKSFKVKRITMKYLFSSWWKIVDCFTTILKFGIPLITCLIFL